MKTLRRVDPKLFAFIVAMWVVVLTCVAVSVAMAHNHTSPAERYYAHRCSQHNVHACIHRATLHWGQDYGYLTSVASCETGGTFNPYAVNGQYLGLFQFGLDAWGRSGYGRYSRTDAKWAALGAAHMFEMGRSSEWNCA